MLLFVSILFCVHIYRFWYALLGEFLTSNGLHYNLNFSDDDLFTTTQEKTKEKEKETTLKASKSKTHQKQESPKLKPATDVNFFGSEPVQTKEKTPKQKKVRKPNYYLMN